VEALLDEVTSLAARLGGTITGEHGDGGCGHRCSHACGTRGAGALRHGEAAFDPDDILNPVPKWRRRASARLSG